MLPAAVPRGDAPTGVRLERHPEVEALPASEKIAVLGVVEHQPLFGP